MRQMMSIPRLLDMPHRNEATTNRNVDQKYSRTSPMRRASQPVSGMAMALATPKKVMTHVPCEDATPRLPAMVGRATLAMALSITDSETPNATARMAHRRRGIGSPS